MSYRRLAEALLMGRPYLGPALRAFQSPPVRHRYILPVVKAVVKEASRPIEILEIGSWAGASAISWASALKKLGLKGRVTCVDPWRPYFDLGKEKSLHYQRMNRAADSGMVYRLFRHNVSSSGFADMIRAQVGESRKILPKLASRSFHVVYIDGSHAFKDVLFDIRQAKRLVRPGGIICGDDLELQAKDLDPAELKAAARSGQDYVFSPRAQAHYHPGVTAAIGRVFGEVCAWDGFWAVRFSGKEGGKVALDLTGSELPPHVASEAVTMEANTPTHHLLSSHGGYFALAKELGPPDVAAELLADEDLPPLVFTGKTLEEVRKKVEQHDKGRAPSKPVDAAPDFYPSPQLVGSYQGYNLVRFKGNVYGLRQSLGAVDVTVGDAVMEARYGDGDAIIGESLDGVKARIDAAEARREMRTLAQDVRALADEILVMRYGTTDRETALIEGNYRGFNLMRHNGRVYGVRASLGDVDLRIGDVALQARYDSSDVVIGETIDGLRARIDAIETSRQTQAEIAAVRTESKKTARGLQEFLERTQAGLQDLAASVEALRAETVEKSLGIQAEVERGLGEAQQAVREVRALVDQLRSQAETNAQGLAASVEALRAETVEKSLGIQAQVERGLGEAQQAVREVRALVDQVRSQAETNAQGLGASVEALRAETGEKVRDVEAQVEQARAEARNAVGEIRRLVDQSRNEAAADAREVRDSVEKLGLELEDAIQEIRALSEQVSEIQYGPRNRQTPQLVEFYRGFKLVRYGGRIYGIRSALGDLDVLLGDTVLEAQYGGEDVVIGDSPDGVKARIDAIEAERAVQELSARLQSLESAIVKT